MDCENSPRLIKKNASAATLMVIVLNVGDGDAIIIRFPPKYGKNSCAVVDCYNASKTIAALDVLDPDEIRFICATHPHYDHTKGLEELMEWCLNEKKIPVRQFWDSGFRHVSKTHYNLIKFLQKHPEISVVYPTSGYETTINRVHVRVLSPSIQLKNRYDTFGTNINNASIVLKLEYPPPDIAPYYQDTGSEDDPDLSQQEKLRQATAVLAGDAQFDAWARMTQEFPELVRTSNRGQMIDFRKLVYRPLHCQFLKAPHHMSKHGLSLEIIETLRPQYTVGSCANKSRHKFPADLTVMAVQDFRRKSTDTGLRFTGHRDKDKRAGTVVAIFREKSTKPLVYCLGEAANKNAPLP